MLLLWLLGGFWYLRLHPLGEQVLVHRGLFSFFIDMERLSVYKNGLIGKEKRENDERWQHCRYCAPLLSRFHRQTAGVRVVVVVVAGGARVAGTPGDTVQTPL